MAGISSSAQTAGNSRAASHSGPGRRAARAAATPLPRRNRPAADKAGAPGGPEASAQDSKQPASAPAISAAAPASTPSGSATGTPSPAKPARKSKAKPKKSVRNLAPTEKGLGGSQGVLTPMSVFWGVLRFISTHVMEPFRIFALLALRPLSVHKTIDVTHLAVSIETLKFFLFAMFLTFACGVRANVEFLAMFRMNTPFDNFLFEISCFVFLMVWSTIQHFILGIWSSHKKLFQVTVGINACIFGYSLVSMVFANILFTLCELLAPELFTGLSMTAADLWDILASGYLYVYLPLLLWFACIRWFSLVAKAPRFAVCVSVALAVVISAELLWFSLTYIRAGLDFVRDYGGVMGAS